jgi:hypothetical protein
VKLVGVLSRSDRDRLAKLVGQVVAGTAARP